MEKLTEELFTGNESLEERLAVVGRFAVLCELGYFGDKTNVSLARGNYKGRFNAGVRKRFSGIYGNTEGCSRGDIEVAAELLGVYDDIYNFELKDKK